MPDFCHLHLNSEYTLLDGACRIKDIPAAAAAAGQKAVALTDRGAMSGCVAFFRACKDAGIKPIIGCEIEISVFEGKSGWTVLLCENAEGYLHLCEAVSEAAACSAAGKALPAGFLAGKTGGLIALSGGSEGEIFAHLSAGDYPRAVETARKFKSLFGQDSFFVELENHLQPAESGMLAIQARVASTAGVGCVATNRVKFIDGSDAAVRDALVCIREGRKLPDIPESSPEYRFKTSDEMAECFRDYPDAVAATARIAERCVFEYDFSTRRLPSFPLPEGRAPGEELLAAAAAGLDRLIASGEIPCPGRTVAEYADRLAQELDVIGRMGYDDYFLIVADYVCAARKAGIAVGPGRGSGCGSLTALCTGITEVDPLRYGLYFERFLNPGRVSMPDIDVDFDSLRRDEVIEYVKNRYGPDRVAQIITYGTLASKAALRDACRVCGVPSELTDRAASMLPSGSDATLREMLDSGRLDGVAALSDETAHALRVAADIEGYPRNVSVHAAGVVITDGPVGSAIPVTFSGGTMITQYDMDDVARLGFLKFDFLALRYLNVIEDAEKQERKINPDFDIAKADLSDPAAYRIISEGLTAGIFQLENAGMTSFVRRMKPRCFEDIVAAIALYRPGPVDSIPKYLAGRSNPSSVVYPHPLIEEILKPTFGCIVYQEQVISIFKALAGYTAGQADLVRRAMSKKDAGALEDERARFVAGAAGNGMSEKDAKDLFDSMRSFSGYAFNRSHAVAYAVITFRTAYLKAVCPAAFFAALLGSYGSDRMPAAAAEAEKLGCPVLPPDVNLSESGFSAEKNGVRFGLSGLRGCGPKFAEAVIDERQNGPFVSFEDFLSRIPERELTRRAAVSLIMSGAFDFTGQTRATLISRLDRELEGRSGRSGISGQLDIFSAASEKTEKPEELPEFSEKKLAEGENEACGMTFRKITAGSSRRAPGDGPSQEASESRAPHPARAADGQSRESAGRDVRMLFVRVPSEDGAVYRKCLNLSLIFDGNMPLCFYFADTKEYRPAGGGVDGSEALIRALKATAGEDSVAFRTVRKKTD